MFVQRFFVEGLAHASYLFGANGEAAVVDPKRDVDDYLDAAQQRGARIVAIFETHPHADFVSGHVELAQRTGAPIYVSHRLQAQYPHRPLRHEAELDIGGLRVRALDTPGHSPDSMSYFVEGDGQRLVFTGDSLFVGDVGRPDLRDATADPRAMAEALYDSLHAVLFRLPEETVVYPAHGAGSLCGRKIGTAPHTTIAAEKAANWANQFADKAEFATAMLANLPDRPAYFAHDVALNLAGARPLAQVPPPQRWTPQQLRQQPDVLVLDTRPAVAYGAGHLAGSLNVGLASPTFSTWVGFFVKPETLLALVVEDAADAPRAWLELARIGYENAHGTMLADVAAWRAAGLEVRQTPQVDVCALGDWLRHDKSVLDVRTPGEWERDHLPGAQWITLASLASRLAEVPHGPLAVVCGGGYRSSLAASLLARAGFDAVTNVAGGWAAFANCGCVEPDSMDLTHSAALGGT